MQPTQTTAAMNEQFVAEFLKRVTQLNQNLVTLQELTITVHQTMQKAHEMQRDVTFLQQIGETLQKAITATTAPQHAHHVTGTAQFGAPTEETQAKPTNVRVFPTGVLPAEEGSVTEPARHPASSQLGELVGEVNTAANNLRQAVEQQRAARAQPTATMPAEEGAAVHASVASEDNRPFLGHFRGTQSLFILGLAPTVMTGAKGFAEPGVSGLKQYSPNLMTASLEQLQIWPTGFYRGEDGVRQLYLNFDHAQIRLHNAQDPMSMMDVRYPASKLRAPGVWNRVDELTVDELRSLHDAIVMFFRALV